LAEIIDIHGVPYYKDQAVRGVQSLQVPLVHLARACVLAEICKFSSEDKNILKGKVNTTPCKLGGEELANGRSILLTQLL
jgi:hypothetical protein